MRELAGRIWGLRESWPVLATVRLTNLHVVVVCASASWCCMLAWHTD